MVTRALLAVAVVAGCLAAPPAQAKHRKPLKGSYDVRIPVPFPGEAESGSHCEDAPDLSKNLRTITLPAAGRLSVKLSGWVGDWVIELFDSKRQFLTSAGALSTGAGETVLLGYRKRSKTSQKVTIGICNFAGGPDGHVDWVFTFDS